MCILEEHILPLKCRSPKDYPGFNESTGCLLLEMNYNPDQVFSTELGYLQNESILMISSYPYSLSPIVISK